MKKKFLTIFSIFTIFLIGLIFVGCETNNKKEEKPVEPKKERLVMGLELNRQPLGYIDEKGEIIGFDVDLAREVCNKLGKELVFKPIAWEEKEHELNSGNIDFFWNGLGYTKDRAEKMELSKSYIKYPQIIVLNKNCDAKTLEDLKGKSVCFKGGSTGGDFLKKQDVFKDLADVKEFRNHNESLKAVLNNECSAAIMGDIVYKALIKENNLENEFKVMEKPLLYTNHVIGFKKGNVELKNKFEEALQSLIDSKKAEEISKKWFGENLVFLKDVENEN